jgi:hypothetical protein
MQKRRETPCENTTTDYPASHLVFLLLAASKDFEGFVFSGNSY